MLIGTKPSKTNLQNGAGPIAMLKIFETSFEDIEEQHRSLYVVHAERGWRLDCNIDEVVRGLKTALRSERAAKEDLRKELWRLKHPADGVEALRAFGGMPEAHLAKGSDAN